MNLDKIRDKIDDHLERNSKLPRNNAELARETGVARTQISDFRRGKHVSQRIVDAVVGYVRGLR